jgi:hypothetical protein
MSLASQVPPLRDAATAGPFAEGAAHRLGAVGDLELGEDAGGQVADSLGDKL